MVAIPENFKLLAGKTDLEEAKLILLGESHVSQHNKDIVGFINAHAKDGDIVLVEGEQAGKKLDRPTYALGMALTLGELPKDQLELAMMKPQDERLKSFHRWCEQGVVRPFTKDVQIYGCDNTKARDEVLSLAKRERELVEKLSQEKERASWYQTAEVKILSEFFRLNDERDEYILKTINGMRNKFPDKRIFTILGKGHVANLLENLKYQPCIALGPKYDPTEKDIDDFKRRIQL